MSLAVSDIEEVFRSVVRRNIALSNRVSSLEAENVELRSRLSLYERPSKDSRNSSIPPGKESLKSQAERRTRSLRLPGDRPTGGQPGHKGSTLVMSDKPDETIIHSSEYCRNCGQSLSGTGGKVCEVRQSIDIPLPLSAIITNHASVKKICPCGCCNRGTFPPHAKPGVSYGVNIHALVAYLSTVQHIPVQTPDRHTQKPLRP